jgi:excisionase family DNA binding protein
MKTTRKNGEWLTRHQVAERLDVHVATVDRWVRLGEIPGPRVHKLGARKGRRVWFDWAAVAKSLGIDE